ncbi:MAG: hypothetical protein LBI28_07635 [Treponema sp.]|jgi:hypothetical protein|nr:hypothetical protein [Treponema sp.]
MTDIESLVTLARHYCIENYNYWHQRYSGERSGQMYSDNDYNIFPRYNVLNAILQGIETIIDKKYNSIDDCKNELKYIGKTSQTIFTKVRLTKEKRDKVKNNAMNEERDKFILFIDNIQEKDLYEVSPLPYNRKLSQNESKEIYKQLYNSWGFSGFTWNQSESKKEIIFLMEKHITDDEKNKIIEHIFKYDKRFFTISEMEDDYETEIIKIDLSETIYTNKNFDWIIYSSHENYITFGGIILLDFLKELFSDRKEKFNVYEW